MQEGRTISRRDWVVAAAIFAVAFALRVPFRSQLVYHGDSAEFALAIGEYNVALSQPHAPGYFLYVMLGRLVNGFVDDPNASLVWLSVVFGSALAAVMYFLGATMFERRVGVVAALLAMTSPQTWFHSEVALTYVVDAFLVCVTVLWCWRAIRRGGTWGDVAGIGVLLAVAGGVRQQTVPALLPVVLFSFWNFERLRTAKLAVAAGVSLVLGLVWFVPMMKMSGGLPLYLEIVRRHAANSKSLTVWNGGWEALLGNVFLAGSACWNGLLLAAVALAVALVYRTFGLAVERKCRWNAEHRAALAALTLWIAPSVLLGMILGFTSEPGQVLSYLPGLIMLAAVALASLRKTWLRAGMVLAICAVNAVVFLFWPAAWGHQLLGNGFTAAAIRRHDTQLARTVELIRSRYDPAEAVVCHAEYFTFGFRHFQVHLPEFDHYQMWRDPTMVSPPDKPMWRVRSGRLESASGFETAGKQTLLLVVPPGWTVKIFGRYFDLNRARSIAGSEGTLYTLSGDRP